MRSLWNKQGAVIDCSKARRELGLQFIPLEQVKAHRGQGEAMRGHEMPLLCTGLPACAVHAQLQSAIPLAGSLVAALTVPPSPCCRLCGR